MLVAGLLAGLRDGLAVAVPVAIVLGLLARTSRHHMMPHAWVAAGTGFVAVLAFGGVLAYVAPGLLSYRERGLVAAVAALLLAGLLTVVIRVDWVGRDLADAVEATVVVLVAFLAVARAGLGTSLVLYAALQGAPANGVPLVGIVGGLGLAVGLGWLVQAGVAHLPDHRLLNRPGTVALVLVTAGIVAGGVHDLQQSGVLPGLGLAANLSGVVNPAGAVAALLGGVFTLAVEPTLLEVLVAGAYLAAMLVPVRFWGPHRFVHTVHTVPAVTQTPVDEVTPAA